MNASKSLFIFLMSFYSYAIFAQQLHTPSEVQQYMKKSKIQYQIDSLSVTLGSVSFLLVEEGLFLVKNEENTELQKREFISDKKTIIMALKKAFIL